MSSSKGVVGLGPSSVVVTVACWKGVVTVIGQHIVSLGIGAIRELLVSMFLFHWVSLIPFAEASMSQLR